MAHQGLGGLNYNSDGYDQAHGFPEGTFTKAYGTFIVVCILSFTALLYTGLMLLRLTELVLTNQTSWEAAKRDRITYLKPFPKNFLPFHSGWRRNLQIACCPGSQPREWIPGDPTKAPRFMFVEDGLLKRLGC